MARKLVKALFLFTTVLILCFTASLMVNAEVYSGECDVSAESDLTWSVDTETGVLRFDGKGYMTNYQSSWDPPWLQYQSYIRTAQVGADVRLDDMAFIECHSLESITVHEDNPNYTTVDGVLFNKDKTVLYFCPINYQASTYTIPDGVKITYNFCFVDNKNLKTVIIPETVKLIESYTFNGMRSLKEITIPSSVEKIGVQVFQSCNRLENIYTPEGSKHYTAVDGVLFTGDMKVLFQYPAAKENTSYIIPDSVQELGAWSFFCAAKLVSLTLPDGLVKIGWEALTGCESLKELCIPAALEELESNFSRTYSLERVTVDKNNEHFCDVNGVLYSKDMKKLLCYPEGKTESYYRIPDGVELIQQGLFIYTRNLKEVFIPSSVRTIESATFTAIEHIMYPGTKEQWSSIEFEYAAEELKDSNRVHLNYNPAINNKTEKIVESGCDRAGTRTVTCSCGYVCSQEYLPLGDHIDTNNDALCDNCKFLMREQTVFEKIISRIREFFESIFDLFRF